MDVKCANSSGAKRRHQNAKEETSCRDCMTIGRKNCTKTKRHFKKVRPRYEKNLIIYMMV
jgi:hypothetical protein